MAEELLAFTNVIPEWLCKERQDKVKQIFGLIVSSLLKLILMCNFLELGIILTLLIGVAAVFG